ncbi:MAG: hypothetical protein FWC96_00960 [Oscillospiraceae bacterium]|nr:hypothetical protein [Oscillospiraceae bacterium]
MTQEHRDFIEAHIKNLESELIEYRENPFSNDQVYDAIREICNIFIDDLPQIGERVLWNTHSTETDARTVIGILRKHLIDNPVANDDASAEEADVDENLVKFLVSFDAWFLGELPADPMIKDQYKGSHYDNWDGGAWHYYLTIDYKYLYKLKLGVDDFEYDKVFSNPSCTIEDFKAFIELIYDECVEKRYEFTIAVNDRLKIFGIPYRLQGGKFTKEGYKGTEKIDKIINYAMCERKIKFSEEMITSKEFLDKKAALDYIVDSLQYLISIAQGDKVSGKYKSSALAVSATVESKMYTIIKSELEEIMKIANEFFDIRHNEYLNKAKEQREALNDKAFIEYLYNRVYALTYLLRIKLTVQKEGAVNG